MKSRRVYIIGMALSVLCLTDCTKDTLPLNIAPELQTGGAFEINRIGASLSGSITSNKSNNVKEYGSMVSVLQSMAEPTVIPASVSDGNDFTVSISGLEHGKTYYYCSYATSGAEYSKGSRQYVTGEVKSFTTLKNGAPLFGSTEVSGIDFTSISISASILDDGGSDIQVSGFLYMQTDDEINSMTVADPDVKSVFCNVENLAFSTTVKDLQSGKRYAICPYAIADGIGYGKVEYVTTTESQFPIVSSTDVDTDLLTASADILSYGSNGISEVGFCYSTENQNPTISNLCVSATLAGNFNAVLSDIKSNVTYYVRAYCKEKNTGDYHYGDVISFQSEIGNVIPEPKEDDNPLPSIQ